VISNLVVPGCLIALCAGPLSAQAPTATGDSIAPYVSDGGKPAPRFEFKMISSGPNRPGLALGGFPFRELVVGLHRGASPSRLAASVDLTEAGVRASLDSLRAEGAVVERGGALHPTCMVVGPEEGAPLAMLAAEAARQALEFMRPAVRHV
jgi:hypothetical protein